MGIKCEIMKPGTGILPQNNKKEKKPAFIFPPEKTIVPSLILLFLTFVVIFWERKCVWQIPRMTLRREKRKRKENNLLHSDSALASACEGAVGAFGPVLQLLAASHKS